MNDNELDIRKDLFIAGGVLGRMDYFVAQLKLMGLVFVAAIPYAAGLFIGGAASMGGMVLTGIMAAGLGYCGYITIFKRLRDIRGTTEKQVTFQVGTVIALSIPVVSFFAALALLFIPGAVTGDGNPFSGQKVKKTIPNNVVKLPQATKDSIKKSA